MKFKKLEVPSPTRRCSGPTGMSEAGSTPSQTNLKLREDSDSYHTVTTTSRLEIQGIDQEFTGKPGPLGLLGPLYPSRHTGTGSRRQLSASGTAHSSCSTTCSSSTPMPVAVTFRSSCDVHHISGTSISSITMPA